LSGQSQFTCISVDPSNFLRQNDVSAFENEFQEIKMKFRISLVLLTSFACSTILAVDAFAQTRDAQQQFSKSKVKIQPLNVKPGLWETTSTFKSSGAPPVPPETLARLTPQQRARLEQRMNANSAGNTNTETNKHCVTKDDVEKADFGQGKGECTYTVQTSTSTRVAGKYSCNVEGMAVNGTVDIAAPDSEHITGSTKGSLSGGSRTMNVESTFTSKFLSDRCENAK
jgi:hypothetical protein